MSLATTRCPTIWGASWNFASLCLCPKQSTLGQDISGTIRFWRNSIFDPPRPGRPENKSCLPLKVLKKLFFVKAISSIGDVGRKNRRQHF
jgi:hypothetical protein